MVIGGARRTGADTGCLLPRSDQPFSLQGFLPSWDSSGAARPRAAVRRCLPPPGGQPSDGLGCQRDPQDRCRRRPRATAAPPLLLHEVTRTSSGSRSAGRQPRPPAVASCSSRPRAPTRRPTCSSTRVTARSSARCRTAAVDATAGASCRTNVLTRAGASSGAAAAARRPPPLVRSRPRTDPAQHGGHCAATALDRDDARPIPMALTALTSKR